MKAYERLLKYVTVHTASAEDSTDTPTTARQFDLAKLLVEEMQELGIHDAYVDDKCYVYGHIPATQGYEDAARLGFIAHLDTIPDFSGVHVKPRVIENYNGGEVALGESGRVLSPAVFSHLPKLKGRTLIVTDGTTVLGADDKAGIAEILTLAERLINEKIPHGPISIGFTPDEEVGFGADHFDLQAFGADFAYTIDGGEEGQIEYENFNACAATFDIKGFNVHPGGSKNKMINASLVAMEINAMLPGAQTPRDTDGYEGFFHLTHMQGNVETAHLDYIVRDHDAQLFEARKKTLAHIEKALNEKYGAGTVTLAMREQYRNMAEKIKPCFHLIDNACEAIREAGLAPIINPIRGGTDGARLSYMGLPCPNLGTADWAAHGPYEHVTAEGMELCVEIALGIVKRFAKKG